MSFNYGDWKPEEELFEEAGVMYSWNFVDGFTAYHYKLVYVPTGLRVPRTVYIMGSDIDTLLAHWNRGETWKVERNI